MESHKRLKMNNIRFDKAALLAGGAVVAAQGVAKAADEGAPAGEGRRPNIVIIMTDQQRADLTAREGYPLDLTPFADSIAAQGCWFDRAYTPCPASGPARVSMLTGRSRGHRHRLQPQHRRRLLLRGPLLHGKEKRLSHRIGRQEPLASEARRCRLLVPIQPSRPGKDEGAC